MEKLAFTDLNEKEAFIESLQEAQRMAKAVVDVMNIALRDLKKGNQSSVPTEALCQICYSNGHYLKQFGVRTNNAIGDCSLKADSRGEC